MKYCPTCHKQYSDEQNFCPNDGTALLVVEGNQASIPAANPPVQPIQIIQMPAAKSKTALYVVAGLIVTLTMIFSFFAWVRHSNNQAQLAQEKQEAQAQAQYDQDYAKRVAAAQLDDGSVKIALDSVAGGSSAAYRDCAQSKLDLYQKRYNVWVGKQGEEEGVPPTKTQTQQNINLAAQASINSCKKEAEGLEMGVPSFDCNKATSPTEIAICTNRELAQLDVKLTNAVRSARFFADDKQAFDVFMKTWIKNRNNCGDDLDCIANSYKGTTTTLNGQVEP